MPFLDHTLWWEGTELKIEAFPFVGLEYLREQINLDAIKIVGSQHLQGGYRERGAVSCYGQSPSSWALLTIILKLIS